MKVINGILLVSTLFSFSAFAQYSEVADCKTLGGVIHSYFGIHDKGPRHFGLLFKGTPAHLGYGAISPSISGTTRKKDIIKYKQKGYRDDMRLQLEIDMRTGQGIMLYSNVDEAGRKFEIEAPVKCKLQ
jgi:hypothetical protein